MVTYAWARLIRAPRFRFMPITPPPLRLAQVILLLALNSILPEARAAWGDQQDGSFLNPVLWSDYNNLDVIRVGDDFYMTAASHHYMGMPILHSKDMVNWRIISRLYRQLDLDPRYDTPGQAYQHGTWAPSIRHQDGVFYVYVCTPYEGLIMTSATDPAGPWTPWHLVLRADRWEDPSPFWDVVENAGGDGPNGRKAYLIRSRLGAGPLIVHEMSWDGRRLLDEGRTVAAGHALEGPKFHQRNGEYYIFAPEGGIDTGYQVVLRGKSIYGPYEKRTILEQGSTSINGPHQGSWIDLESGQSWFYHFQQNRGWGRIAHLQPAGWHPDGWPWIGEDHDGNGIGEPVTRPRLPEVGGRHPIQVPQSTDEFSSTELGLQWMWNHNPDDARWSLGARPGWLRLNAQPLATASGRTGTLFGEAVPFVEDSIHFAYNTIVQHALGQVNSAETRLDAGGMIDGQRAGLVLFGQQYSWVGVVRENGRTFVRARVNERSYEGPELSDAEVHLRATMNENSETGLAYSLDGEHFVPIGEPQRVGRTWFEGIKYGLFTYHLSSAPAGGHADFDFLHYQHDGPAESGADR